jgi:hypothetical protein
MRTIALTLLVFGALSCSAQPSAAPVATDMSSGSAPISAAQAIEKCRWGDNRYSPDCLIEQANLARTGDRDANLATSPSLSPAIEICVSALKATLCTSKCPVMVVDNQGRCSIEMR